MPTSITQKAVSLVSKNSHKKLSEFKRLGNHLYRNSNDLIHCIHFQYSQWNSGENGKFTINLAIVSESLYKFWTGNSLPKNPATALWPIQVRLSSLLPEKFDKWWTVDLNTNLVILTKEIIECLQAYALPFFSKYSSINELFDELKFDKSIPGIFESQRPLLLAMIYKLKQNEKESIKLIQKAFHESEGSRFQETVVLLANRLGLHINLIT
ncbi:PF14137 domain protein [Leptospira weilii serovar Ranarum str. ICFT]|uniref:PF14137 domain protein n=1 Tax=Leptospira weilii serovar Ranarum str. ICFT TaxID=1218598 RepID=N1WM09_9LEPT|nr:DUF4304 domain-containing protein [Leptospira weilii]EMY78282.1 PF14137 domain protein [Leptospira weilii serovar Ranarum str. ICFT]